VIGKFVLLEFSYVNDNGDCTDDRRDSDDNV